MKFTKKCFKLIENEISHEKKRIYFSRIFSQDVVRTESYLNAIKKNVDLFRDKIVLDVGCGTGILSMACLRYGHAKMVIAVDMSDIIYDAMAIAKWEKGFVFEWKIICFDKNFRENNIDETKLVFLRGRIEDVTLPVEKVRSIEIKQQFPSRFFCFLFSRSISSSLNGWV